MKRKRQLTIRPLRWCPVYCVVVIALASVPDALRAQERVPVVKRQIAVKAGVTPAKMHEEPLVAVIEIAQATELPATLTTGDRSQLNRIAGDLESGNVDGAMNRWERFVERLEEGRDEANINSLIQLVLRESYVETNEDLRSYAEKVKAFNEMKKKVREHIRDVREALAATPRGAPVPVRTLVIATHYTEGGELVHEGPRKEMSDREIAEYVLELSDQLQQSGDDAQLANIDLQSAMQKHQQAIQMMSNISKQLHDTAMAVIRKIG